MLYTLQDISLACCSGMCIVGVLFFWMILAIARRAGQGIGGIPQILASVGGGGLLSIFSMGGMMELLTEFLQGRGGDGPRR